MHRTVRNSETLEEWRPVCARPTFWRATMVRASCDAHHNALCAIDRIGKVAFVLVDGLGDVSVESLGHRSPLSAAATPALDTLARAVCAQACPCHIPFTWTRRFCRAGAALWIPLRPAWRAGPTRRTSRYWATRRSASTAAAARSRYRLGNI
jgi:hypothetical protein